MVLTFKKWPVFIEKLVRMIMLSPSGLHGAKKKLRPPLFLFLILLLILKACIPVQTQSNRRLSEDTATTEDDLSSDDLDSGLNFIQSGGEIYTSTFSALGDFSDVFYLRGEEIHRFLEDNTDSSLQLCLSSYFSNQSKWVVLAATPRSFFDFSGSKTEYYLEINSLQLSTNNALCNKPNLISTLVSSQSGSNAEFLLENICPSCSTSTTSGSLFLYTPGGIEITAIDVGYLNFSLTTSSSSSDGGFCASSGTCQRLGFDCCLEGQCVNDRSVKASVDTSSSAYLLALEEVLADSSKYLDYPEFFYLCDLDIPPTTDPGDETDPVATAAALLEELGELYGCTNTDSNELAICTVRYDNGGDFKNTTLTLPVDDRNFSIAHGLSASSSLDDSNITYVEYAGEVLYQNQVNNGGITLTSGKENDDLTTGQTYMLTKDPQTDAPDDVLIVKYKIDGSCESISSSLAKCHKVYVQAQDSGAIDDHSDAPPFDERLFYLPFYADTSKVLKVEVDDIPFYETTNWTLDTSGTYPAIDFNASETIYSGQVVKITFYVDLATYPNTMISKQAAIDEINGYCWLRR